ncbi:hypothetical protein HMGUsm2_300 [Serratia phage HMGUsm2]|uniref:Uncharacterized protein n=1 Tax=Serratia phage HMGUsm2 TaxID=3025411 RepID=A0AAE9YDI2_9CAUD|nr:hypothetical protein HMGUsm2_300 [Serratia phage HMGUsm2]
MMGRLYSGNLNAFMAAKGRLEKLGCEVTTSSWHDGLRMRDIVGVTVKLLPGYDILGKETFGHYDIDVVINTATEWMHRLAEQLEHWK